MRAYFEEQMEAAREADEKRNSRRFWVNMIFTTIVALGWLYQAFLQPPQ